MLAVNLRWQEFWYSELVPWVHYVPLRADGSDSDAVLSWLETHDDVARTIADNGYWLIVQRLRMEDVQGYWNDLLLEYSQRLSYEVEQDPTLLTIVAPSPSPKNSEL